MKPYIDLDGVLADMASVFAQWACVYTGRDTITQADITQWDPLHALGIPRHEEPKLWTYTWENYHSFYPGALEFLQTLPEPEIFTTRPTGAARNNLHQRFNLQLRSAGAEVHAFNDWHAKEKFLRYRDDPNAFAVEDNIEFLLRLPPMKMKLFLMDRPWNQSRDLKAPYVRVYSYYDILERTGK